MGSRLKKKLKLLSFQARVSLICYRLRITLAGSDPPVWRLAQVDGAFTLGALHEFLREEFRWNDEQPHKFIVKGGVYIDPEFATEDVDEWDEGIAIAALALKEGDRFEYVFDEKWHHELVVEKIFNLEKPDSYEMMLDGAGGCLDSLPGAEQPAGGKAEFYL